MKSNGPVRKINRLTGEARRQNRSELPMQLREAEVKNLIRAGWRVRSSTLHVLPS